MWTTVVWAIRGGGGGGGGGGGVGVEGRSGPTFLNFRALKKLFHKTLAY